MPSFQKLGKPLLLLFMAVAVNSCANTSPTTSQNQNQNQNISYITPPVTFMREFPKYDSSKVAAVFHGDQVAVMSRQADDWCMVQAMQSGKIGWIQSALLSAQPIPTPTYFVQVGKVRLQDAPQKNASSPEVSSQGDKVRKLFGESGRLVDGAGGEGQGPGLDPGVRRWGTTAGNRPAPARRRACRAECRRGDRFYPARLQTALLCGY